MAERERRKRLPSPASTPATRQPQFAPADDPARRHQRLQQALVEAVRADREPAREAQEELCWFARLGMTEAQALDYLLRKYPSSS
jgi:hypothetical protein